MSYCKFVHCKSFLGWCQEVKYNVIFRCTVAIVFVFFLPRNRIFRDILVVDAVVSLALHHIFVHNLTLAMCLSSFFFTDAFSYRGPWAKEWEQTILPVFSVENCSRPDLKTWSSFLVMLSFRERVPEGQGGGTDSPSAVLLPQFSDGEQNMAWKLSVWKLKVFSVYSSCFIFFWTHASWL